MVIGGGGGKTGIASEGWRAVWLGKKLYRIFRESAGRQFTYITQTGVAVNTELIIIRPFRLVRIELQHCASTDAASTDALTWSFNRYEEFKVALPAVSYTSSTASHFVEEFGEGYEFDSGRFRLTTNTTNTDRIYVNIYVQFLEEVPA